MWHYKPDKKDFEHRDALDEVMDLAWEAIRPIDYSGTINNMRYIVRSHGREVKMGAFFNNFWTTYAVLGV